MSFNTELLAPGGSLEKALTAFAYGADAVYIGGQKYGLRSRATNFTLAEIDQLCHVAREKQKKVYVVINSFFHDEDFLGLKEFSQELEKLGVSALIVSDLGAVNCLSENTNLDIHLSTQASCVNSYAGKFWRKQGVKRLILGRESSLKEAAEIKKQTGLEVELFVHGSLCMAYSGHCVISNYTSGRDSNRGGCAHSCRYEYDIEGGGEKIKKTFLSSKDLSGIHLIPQFHQYGIDSMKVEGRMKSTHYVGTISKAYSEGIKLYREHPQEFTSKLPELIAELEKLANRNYTEGNLLTKADLDSVFDEREYIDSAGFESVGFVKKVDDKQGMIVEVRKKFSLSDELEGLPFHGKPIAFNAKTLQSLSGQIIESAKPSSLVRLASIKGLNEKNLIRRRL